MSTDATRLPLGSTLVVKRKSALRRARLAPLPASWVAAAGGTALAGILVLSTLIVLIANDRASFLSPPSHAGFPGWMSGPLGHLLPGVDPSRTVLQWGFSLAVVFMFVLYVVMLICARRINTRWAIVAVVLLHVVFFLSAPLPLTDVFNYINYGRMGVVHHLNPYATIPSVEPHTDPAFIYSNWHHLLSPYGPLFTLFTYALAPLGVPAGYWVLKASLMLASLGGLALVWRCARLLGRAPLPAFLFVGANPLMLVWGLGGDHNDFFMVLFMMLAFYLLLSSDGLRRRMGISDAPVELPAGAAGPPQTAGSGAAGPPQAAQREDAAPAATSEAARPAGRAGWSARWRGPGLWRDLGAGGALACVVAIKASGGILLPVVLAGAARRWRLLAGMVIGGMVLAVATAVAFGAYLPNLAEQSKLVTGVGLPNLLGYALGLGGEDATLSAMLNVILILAVAGASVYAWRSRAWLPAAAIAMLALLLTLSWELPWYVFWLLPLAALARARWLRVAALMVSLYLILAWIPIVSDLIHGLNFRPTATPLGEQHSRLTKTLLH
ncbi:MAG TPA: hypothetical protein VGN69_05515 [Solirubrobacteraceae bacterium]|jgi:SAM-dependent methyltransferase|nr:hypothetical protein [Solirubrobacteraceae bacterium]